MQVLTKADKSYKPPGLGDMKHTNMDCVILDDFLDDPMAVRQQILNLDFRTPRNPNGGIISYNANIPDNILQELRRKLSAHFQTSVDFHPRSKCALTFSDVPKVNIAHVDGGNNMCLFNWTVIVYLNTPDQCRGGTNLYRHIPTGDIHNEKGIDFYKPDYPDASKWELMETVKMKFNRALLCPAWRFHGLDFTFGDTKESARMTLNPKAIVM